MATSTTSKSLADVFGEQVGEIADGSQVSDVAALHETVEALQGELKRGLSSYRGMTTVLKRCADLRTRACSLILRPNGHPDWAAQSDAYRTTVAAAEAQLWAEASSDEKRRVDGAIRQHKGRGGYLEHYITRYVLSTLTAEDVAGCKWAERTDGLEILTGEIPPKVKSAVAAEYKSADLQVPAKFGGEAQGGGRGTSGPSNPRADFETALGAMENVAPVVAASDLLRAVSALVGKVADPKVGEVNERQKVEQFLLRIGQVATLGAKSLAGKATEQDIATLAKVSWTKQDAQ